MATLKKKKKTKKRKRKKIYKVYGGLKYLIFDGRNNTFKFIK